MVKIIVKNLFVIFVLAISITILAQNHSPAFAYLSPLPNSTNPSATTTPPTQSYPPCPPHYTPSNFPCTVTIGNYTKVIGAPEGIANQSPVTTPAVPEFGPLVGIMITISVIGSLVVSRKFSSKL